MRRNVSPRFTSGFFMLCLSLAGACIFLGVLISFRTAGGTFAEAAQLVGNISFDGINFADSLKRALLADMAYCFAVFIFSAGFPLSVLPGGYVLVKSFLLGVTAGLAARCCVMKEALSIFFAIFISNVLILPIYILLFIISVKFSYKTCAYPVKDKMAEYCGFSLKVIIFFAVMCIFEVVQIGTGVLVLK